MRYFPVLRGISYLLIFIGLIVIAVGIISGLGFYLFGAAQISNTDVITLSDKIYSASALYPMLISASLLISTSLTGLGLGFMAAGETIHLLISIHDRLNELVDIVDKADRRR